MKATSLEQKCASRMSCRSGDEALGLSFVLPTGGLAKIVDLNAFTSQEKLLLNTFFINQFLELPHRENIQPPSRST
jgi:hypothetical protein